MWRSSSSASPKPTVSIMIASAPTARLETFVQPAGLSEVKNGMSRIMFRSPFLLCKQLPNVDLPLPVMPTSR